MAGARSEGPRSFQGRLEASLPGHIPEKAAGGRVQGPGNRSADVCEAARCRCADLSNTSLMVSDSCITGLEAVFCVLGILKYLRL